jgi:hypothetical protein
MTRSRMVAALGSGGGRIASPAPRPRASTASRQAGLGRLGRSGVNDFRVGRQYIVILCGAGAGEFNRRRGAEFLMEAGSPPHQPNHDLTGERMRRFVRPSTISHNCPSWRRRYCLPHGPERVLARRNNLPDRPRIQDAVIDCTTKMTIRAQDH